MEYEYIRAIVVPSPIAQSQQTIPLAGNYDPKMLADLYLLNDPLKDS